MEDVKILTDTIFEKGPACSFVYAQAVAKILFDAGYRLDPYPEGKTKDELLESIRIQGTKIDRAKVLLRFEHEERMIYAFGSTHNNDPQCAVCKFLNGGA